jgi:LysM repeat protein
MSRIQRIVAGAVLAAVTLAAPAVAANAASPSTYVVKPGDSISGIARKLDVPVGDLLAANGLQLTSTILPGQQLQVPGAAAPAVTGGSYTVAVGDSLARIAQRHRVTLNALLSANGFTTSSLILPGQTIALPAGAVAPSAPSAPSAPAAPAAPATGGTYTVRAGDSLGRIAQRHGVTLNALLSANGFTTSSLIVPGQAITLPAGAAVQRPAAETPAAPAAPAVPAAGGTYTVRAGDSLGRIAQRHRVGLNALLAVNGFSVTSLILPGQAITLPAGAVTAPTAPTGPAPTAPAGGGSGASGGAYTIRAGDSLGGIAQRYGVALGALLAANGFSSSSLIVPGQTISLPAGAAPQTPTAAPTGTRVDAVVQYALAQQGKPYAFFTAGPDTFDCSGLTKAAYARIGVTLVHQSSAQARQGTAVDFMSEPIQAGDLIFLITRDNEVINHVGMAISSTQWVHAPAPGQPVRVGSIPSTSVIVAVRRYV